MLVPVVSSGWFGLIKGVHCHHLLNGTQTFLDAALQVRNAVCSGVSELLVSSLCLSKYSIVTLQTIINNPLSTLG